MGGCGTLTDCASGNNQPSIGNASGGKGLKSLLACGHGTPCPYNGNLCYGLTG